MKNIVLGLTLLLTATAVQDAHAQRVRLSGLKRYSQVQTGDLTIPAGASTSGSVMVIRGNLDVYGNVDGAATAVLGDVIVHEGGRVRGGAVALGGHVRNEGGSILGVIKDIGRLICERDPELARERDRRLLAEAGGTVRTVPRQELIPPKVRAPAAAPFD